MTTMRRFAVWAVLATCVFTTSLLAADPNGIWRGVVNLPAQPGNGRAGGGQPANNPPGNGQAANAPAAPRQPLPFVARLKQEGDKITGKLDGIGGAPDVEIMDGKFENDMVTFTGTRNINNVPVKFNYTATFTDPDSLDFKILRADGTGNPLESMTKRSKD